MSAYAGKKWETIYKVRDEINKIANGSFICRIELAVGEYAGRSRNSYIAAFYQREGGTILKTTPLTYNKFVDSLEFYRDLLELSKK